MTRSVQATVHTFDPVSGDGSVIGDDGGVLRFSAEAWASGRLRTLRVGQRVRLQVSSGAVTAMTLVTFPEHPPPSATS